MMNRTKKIEDNLRVDIEHQLQGLLQQWQEVQDSQQLAKLEAYQTHSSDIDKVVTAAAYDFSVPIERTIKGALRVVHWNIERGRNLDDIKERLENHPYLQQADVLILTETDIGMARSGNRHVAGEIADLLGFHFLYVNSYLCISKGVKDELLAQGENELGLHGISLLSRLPIVKWQGVELPKWLDKMQGPEKRLGKKRALLALLEDPHSQKNIAIAGVHLDAQSSPNQRKLQAKAVLEEFENFAPADVPRIVGGDFNTTTYSSFDRKGLTFNLMLHILRGLKRTINFDYIYPDVFYERLFRMAQEKGYQFRNLNQLGVGTFKYNAEDKESLSKILDVIPSFVYQYFERKAKHIWNGEADLKLDWFLGRNVRVLGEGEHRFKDYSSQSPIVIRDIPITGPNRLSDHFPIGIDIQF